MSGSRWDAAWGSRVDTPEPAAPRPGGAAGSEAAEEPLVSVKVWDAPLRLLHWSLVLSIVVLTVTGWYIGHPFLSRPPGPATGNLMGWMRTVHLAVGWVFTVVLLARTGWAFRGNRWARWDQIIPVAKYRRDLIRPSVEYYAFRRLEPPPVVGHNPLAGLTYLVLFGMFGLQVFTGFALEALHDPGGLMGTLTGWAFHVLPVPQVRLVHALIMWLTWGFVVHHVYSAWLVDREERSGELSSIVVGWKSLPASRASSAPELSDPRPRPRASRRRSR